MDKIRTGRIDGSQRIHNVANKVIGMDKRIDSVVPGKEIMLRRKNGNMGNTR